VGDLVRSLNLAAKCAWVNASVWRLWNQCRPESVFNIPFFYEPDMLDGDILFVGLNPSFSERAFRREFEFINCVLGRNHYKSFKAFKSDAGRNYLKMDWKRFRRTNVFQFLAAEGRYARKKPYAYYQRHAQLAEAVGGLKWAHLDLFFFRETAQRKAERDLMFTAKQELSEFSLQQLNLAFALLATTRPKVIVVVNALAGEIFRRRMGLFRPVEDDSGFHSILLGKKPVPVFFTSKQYLDKGSAARLEWHIKKAMDWIPGQTLKWV